MVQAEQVTHTLSWPSWLYVPVTHGCCLETYWPGEQVEQGIHVASRPMVHVEAVKVFGGHWLQLWQAVDAMGAYWLLELHATQAWPTWYVPWAHGVQAVEAGSGAT